VVASEKEEAKPAYSVAILIDERQSKALVLCSLLLELLFLMSSDKWLVDCFVTTKAKKKRQARRASMST
jgi:hypothetical protein